MLCHIPLPCIISLSDGRLQKENTKRKLGEKNHGVKYVFGLKHSDLQLWVSLLQVVRKDRPTQLLFYLGQSMTTEIFILKFQSYDKKGIKSYVMNWNEGGKYCRLHDFGWWPWCQEDFEVPFTVDILWDRLSVAQDWTS